MTAYEKLLEDIKILEEKSPIYCGLEKRKKKILEAFEELSRLGFKVDLIQDDNGNFSIVFLDFPVEAKLEFYGSDKNKYKFFVTTKRLDNSYKINYDLMPKKVTVGKATAKKIMMWLQWATEESNRILEYNQKSENNKLESIKKIQELKALPGVKFRDQSYKQDESQGYVECENFWLSFTINDNGYLRTELKTFISSKYSCEDLFIALAKGGF